VTLAGALTLLREKYDEGEGRSLDGSLVLSIGLSTSL
jgi:hypothetical protein